ncbi:MAG TPA: FAD-dependent oxidoreductase [Allosphingosinicella sp.]|jgi:glycine/D-amino acid oxidase-like deaminating enzyme
MLQLDRRKLLESGALAGAGLVLPGCATTMASQRPAPATGCLPPVEVAPERVIRTMAGLRPYRAAGFVVRAEPLGDKRLVHNYGHGGAGITLSWGSSKLAAELGLQGHQGPVAVIGAGVMGLTTARLVQEAGYPVTLYTAALPPDTTSNIAGGQWHPFGHYRDSAVTPEWRQQFLRAADYSWRRFQIMVGDDYGIRWLPTYSEGSEPEPPLIPGFPPINRVLRPGEHPFPVPSVYRFDTLYVETGRFLRQLLRDVQIGGGRIAIRNFATPADVAALPEPLVFNCTGLGARQLFGDAELRPARGQLAILLPQPEVRYAFTGRAGYMFPRNDGILLGGTFELDEWSAVPEPATIQTILASHRHLFEAFRCTA